MLRLCAVRTVAAHVRPGERLLLHVASSAWLRWDVNPQSNVPTPCAAVEDGVPASHVLYHGPSHTSALSLSVVEDAGAEASTRPIAA